MTTTLYLSGSRKVTIVVDDSAVRSKDQKASMAKSLSGTASMWGGMDDAGLEKALRVHKGVTSVQIDRY